MLNLSRITLSPAETEQTGEELAKSITGGTVVAMFGDLGAGKTAFVRGMAKGFGITDRVTSPTFAIVNEYQGEKIRLCHFDMYRLSSAEELYEIGWEDYLTNDTVCAVEWSENILPAIPKGSLKVNITSFGENKRKIEISEM